MNKHQNNNPNHIQSLTEPLTTNNQSTQTFSILDILNHNKKNHLQDIEYLEMLKQQDPLRQNSAIKAINFFNSPRGKQNNPIISKLIDEPKVVNFILETLKDPKRPRISNQRWTTKVNTDRTQMKTKLNKTNKILIRSNSSSNSPNSSFIDPKFMQPFQNPHQLILKKRINKYKNTNNPSQIYKLTQWLKNKLKQYKITSNSTTEIIQCLNLTFNQTCKILNQQNHQLSNILEFIKNQFTFTYQNIIQNIIHQNQIINQKYQNLTDQYNQIIIKYQNLIKSNKIEFQLKSKNIVQNFHNCLNLKQEIQQENISLQNDLKCQRNKLRFVQDGLAKALNILLQIGQNKINFLNIEQEKIIMRMNSSYHSQPENYRIFYQWCSTVLKIITNMQDQQQQSKNKKDKIIENQKIQGPGYLENLALSSIGKFMIDFDSSLSVNDVQKILLNFTNFIPNDNNGLEKESAQESLATKILELHEKNAAIQNLNMNNKKDQKSSIFYHSGLAPNLREISEKFKGVNVEVQVVTQIEQDAIGIQVSPQTISYGITAKPKQKSKETSTQPWIKEKLSITNIQDMDIYIFGERNLQNSKPPTSPRSPKRKNNEEIKRKLSILPSYVSMRSSVSSSRRSSKNQQHLSLVVEQLRSKIQKKPRKSQKYGQTLIIPDSSVIQETIEQDKDKSNEIGNISGRRGSLNRKINKRVTKVEYPPKRVTFIQKNNDQTEQFLQEESKIVPEKAQKSNKMNPKIKISLNQNQSSHKKNEKMLKNIVSSFKTDYKEDESIDNFNNEDQNEINKQIQLLLSKFGNHSEEEECFSYENQLPSANSQQEFTTENSSRKDTFKENNKSRQKLEKFSFSKNLEKIKRESQNEKRKQKQIHKSKLKSSKTNKKNDHNTEFQGKSDKQSQLFQQQNKLKQFAFQNDNNIGFTFKLAQYFQQKRTKADSTLFPTTQNSELSKMLLKIKSQRQKVHSIHITPNQLLTFINNEIQPIIQTFLSNFQKIIEHENLSPNDLKFKLMQGSQLSYYHSLLPLVLLLIQKTNPNNLTSIGNFWRGIKNLKYSYKNFQLYQYLLDGTEIEFDIFIKIIHYLGDGKWLGKDPKQILFNLLQVQLYFILNGYLTQKQIQNLITQLKTNKQIIHDKISNNQNKNNNKNNFDDINIKSIPDKNYTQDKISLHTLTIKIFKTITQKKHHLSRKFKNITDLLSQENDHIHFKDFIFFISIFPIQKNIRQNIIHQFMFHIQNHKIRQETFLFFFNHLNLLSNQALEKNILFQYFKIHVQKHHQNILTQIIKNPQNAIKTIQTQSPMLNKICQNIIQQKNIKINRSLLVLFYQIIKQHNIQSNNLTNSYTQILSSTIQ